MTTQEHIVAKALELFNRRNIEHVGMRELAAELGMRIGNITYYFPTKDDLVYRIARDLTELNSQTIVEKEEITIQSFFDMMRQAFENHCRYRCLFVSFVHLMQNPLMAERYKISEKTRYDTWRRNVANLEKNGYIALKSAQDTEFLVSAIALIARFWISEATVSYRHLAIEKQIDHYIDIIARILLPYTTAKGRRQLQPFMESGG